MQRGADACHQTKKKIWLGENIWIMKNWIGFGGLFSAVPRRDLSVKEVQVAYHRS